jgi:hypothetical protein
MFARIRKSVVAGIGAGLAAFIAALVQSATEGVVNRDEVSKAIGLALASAATVGLATYKVRNAGTVNGSEPAPGSSDFR